jgi:hypothetical protein
MPAQCRSVPLPDTGGRQRPERDILQVCEVKTKVTLTRLPPSDTDPRTVPKDDASIVAERHSCSAVIHPGAPGEVGFDQSEPPISVSLRTEGVGRIRRVPDGPTNEA